MNYPTLLVSLLLSGLSLIPAVAAERPAPAVTAIEVQQQPLVQHYRTVGLLQAHQRIELRTEVSGKIAKIHTPPTQTVKRDQILLELDNRTLLNQLQRHRIDLKLAEQQLQRLQALASNRSTTREALDIAETEVARLNAEIAAVELELEDYQIRAPFDGVLGNFDWVEASWISAAELFTTLDDLTELEVQFDLPERFLSAVELGDAIELYSQVWPEQSFDAEISLIAPRIDADRATLSVEARVANPDQRLRPGMRVSVQLPDSNSETKLVIPVRSLIHERDQTQVFKLTDENKALVQTITTGITTEHWVEVTSGLNPGDRIIDRGIVKARANRPVNVLNRPESDS